MNGGKSSPPDDAQSELAPQGKFRLAFPVGSALYVRRDSASGALRGASIDLGNELAARLGVPFEALPYGSVRELIDATGTGAWDVATLVIEEGRRSILDYTRAYLEADSTYLVLAGSPIAAVADADKPGTRIGVAQKSAFDLFLTRTIKHATLVRYQGVAAAFDGLKTGGCDLVAAPRQVLAAAQGQFPGSRILDDFFDMALVGMAVPKGRQAKGLAYLNAFLEEAIASGWVAQAIARAGMQGAKVPGV